MATLSWTLSLVAICLFSSSNRLSFVPPKGSSFPLENRHFLLATMRCRYDWVHPLGMGSHSFPIHVLLSSNYSDWFEEGQVNKVQWFHPRYFKKLSPSSMEATRELSFVWRVKYEDVWPGTSVTIAEWWGEPFWQQSQHTEADPSWLHGLWITQ